ncbi:methionyl-tRNA formyltransferase [Saccharophagus degradans]|uniref:Formyltransferase family protein n=1 Tax=Saccharophagus degradans TaxID=86304 RepID=A0AAW7XCY7_9GAMM|nr:formyltransferase family protein [Saccharophagus degradans]MDO6424421.1 formyltransferase family protein [Saccharophagus degradans]MDO6608372.1 formyltransferase family protein [Saccharophagus degradans]
MSNVSELCFSSRIEKPQVVVFACGAFALSTLQVLSHQQMLAGVILPDPAELMAGQQDVNSLASQLRQAGIPFQMCCKDKLTLIAEQITLWKGNVGLVVSYPHVFPVEIIQHFGGHFYNVHASLLPNYKGPAPLYWQLRNREEQTAITIHAVTAQIDSGEIVARRVLPIHPLDTLQSLANRVAYEASAAITEFIGRLKSNKSIHVDADITTGANSNNHAKNVYARRPSFSDYCIDFLTMDALAISAMCRAGNNLPNGALIDIKGVPISVLQSTALNQPTYGTQAGTIIFIGEPEGLVVSTLNGALRLDILMSADGIFNGLAFAERFNLDAGQQLCSVSISTQEKTA